MDKRYNIDIDVQSNAEEASEDLTALRKAIDDTNKSTAKSTSAVSNVMATANTNTKKTADNMKKVNANATVVDKTVAGVNKTIYVANSAIVQFAAGFDVVYKSAMMAYKVIEGMAKTVSGIYQQAIGYGKQVADAFRQVGDAMLGENATNLIFIIGKWVMLSVAVNAVYTAFLWVRKGFLHVLSTMMRPIDMIGKKVEGLIKKLGNKNIFKVMEFGLNALELAVMKFGSTVAKTFGVEKWFIKQRLAIQRNLAVAKTAYRDMRMVAKNYSLEEIADIKRIASARDVMNRRRLLVDAALNRAQAAYHVAHIKGDEAEIIRQQKLIDMATRHKEEAIKNAKAATEGLKARQKAYGQSIKLGKNENGVLTKTIALKGKAVKASQDLGKSVTKTKEGFDKVKQAFGNVVGPFGAFIGAIKSAKGPLGKFTMGIVNFASKIPGGVMGLMAMGGVVVALTTKFSKLVTASIGLGDGIAKGASRLGVSIKQYQKWDGIMNMAGTSISSLQTINDRLIGSMKDAKGVNKQATAFKKLGIEIRDSSGALRGQETVLKEAMIALSGMSNKTERNALAQELLGRSARELNPILDQGRQKVEALMGAESGMITMSDEMAKASETVTDGNYVWMKSLELLKNTAIEPLVIAWAKFITAVKGNEELNKGIAAIGKTIGAVVQTIVDLGTGLAMIATNKWILGSLGVGALALAANMGTLTIATKALNIVMSLNPMAIVLTTVLAINIAINKMIDNLNKSASTMAGFTDLEVDDQKKTLDALTKTQEAHDKIAKAKQKNSAVLMRIAKEEYETQKAIAEGYTGGVVKVVDGIAKVFRKGWRGQAKNEIWNTNSLDLFIRGREIQLAKLKAQTEDSEEENAEVVAYAGKTRSDYQQILDAIRTNELQLSLNGRLTLIEEASQREVDIVKAVYDADLISAAEYMDAKNTILDASDKAKLNEKVSSAGELDVSNLKVAPEIEIDLTNLKVVGAEDGNSILGKIFGFSEDSELSDKITGIADFAVSKANDILNVVNGFADLAKQKRDQELTDIKAQQDAEMKMYAGSAKARASMQASLDKKMDALRKTEGEKAKKAQVAGAIINMAGGIAAAVALAMTLGPIAGPIVGGINSAIVAVGAGVQIAKIKQQKFRNGGSPNGPIPGNSYSGDKVPVYANSDELLLNKRQQTTLYEIANGKGEQSMGSGGSVNVSIENFTGGDSELARLKDMLTDLVSSNQMPSYA